MFECRLCIGENQFLTYSECSDEMLEFCSNAPPEKWQSEANDLPNEQGIAASIARFMLNERRGR